MPMNQLVDVEAELARIAREKEKTEKMLASIRGKLSNEGFVAKAPEAVVNAEREKAKKYEALLQQLNESEARMKAI